tara:strand:- start:141 stop:464 length:324 start_codon:yes stop_codon:yes gene_type:complete
MYKKILSVLLVAVTFASTAIAETVKWGYISSVDGSVVTVQLRNAEPHDTHEGLWVLQGPQVAHKLSVEDFEKSCSVKAGTTFYVFQESDTSSISRIECEPVNPDVGC